VSSAQEPSAFSQTFPVLQSLLLIFLRGPSAPGMAGLLDGSWWRDQNTGHGQEVALDPDLRPRGHRTSRGRRGQVSFAHPSCHRGAAAVLAGDGDAQPETAAAAHRPGSAVGITPGAG